ncbi:MAG: helix-turn-helix domain-containing protein [Asgard group archaeon]|nr:helix-turn-helix domain-containing protein [Asgard group archaeon]
MDKKLLIQDANNYFTKDLRLLNDPSELKPLLHPLRWKILKMLHQQPTFPAALARKLGVHEQKIYYHIKQLKNKDFITVIREDDIRGAKAKIYGTTNKAFGVDLDPAKKGQKLIVKETQPTSFLKDFFAEFINDGKFNGLIVVGSPDPHGPHKTWARDGHYAIYLAMLLGQFVQPSNDLYVKLDVEVRAAKNLNKNLLLIGGPAVNLVTKDINAKMPSPTFDNHIQGIAPQAQFGRGITSKKEGKFYSQHNVGIIFKQQNPFNPQKTIIGFAGQGRRGTKATILAIINHWQEILKSYETVPFRKIIEGYDLDGDGKVDSIEIIE